MSHAGREAYDRTLHDNPVSVIGNDIIRLILDSHNLLSLTINCLRVIAVNRNYARSAVLDDEKLASLANCSGKCDGKCARRAVDDAIRILNDIC